MCKTRHSPTANEIPHHTFYYSERETQNQNTYIANTRLKVALLPLARLRSLALLRNFTDLLCFALSQSRRLVNHAKVIDLQLLTKYAPITVGTNRKKDPKVPPISHGRRLVAPLNRKRMLITANICRLVAPIYQLSPSVQGRIL